MQQWTLDRFAAREGRPVWTGCDVIFWKAGCPGLLLQNPSKSRPVRVKGEVGSLFPDLYWYYKHRSPRMKVPNQETDGKGGSREWFRPWNQPWKMRRHRHCAPDNTAIRLPSKTCYVGYSRKQGSTGAWAKRGHMEREEALIQLLCSFKMIRQNLKSSHTSKKGSGHPPVPTILIITSQRRSAFHPSAKWIQQVT